MTSIISDLTDLGPTVNTDTEDQCGKRDVIIRLSRLTRYEFKSFVADLKTY